MIRLPMGAGIFGEMRRMKELDAEQH
jgi:hypothetical protein